MKKTMLWIGAALMAVSLSVACSSKSPAGTTPVENTETPAETPAGGGDAYGGGAYGAPAEAAPEAAPATP